VQKYSILGRIPNHASIGFAAHSDLLASPISVFRYRAIEAAEAN
jgi:hypothetical protein